MPPSLVVLECASEIIQIMRGATKLGELCGSLMRLCAVNLYSTATSSKTRSQRKDAKNRKARKTVISFVCARRSGRSYGFSAGFTMPLSSARSRSISLIRSEMRSNNAACDFTPSLIKKAAASDRLLKIPV